MTADHPDLIDRDGERWSWTVEDILVGGDEGYQCRELFCLYGRATVEREFGPVTEVAPPPERSCP